MKLKKAIAWSYVNKENHPSLIGEERTIAGLMPVLDALFPGINYYSISGFAMVNNGYAIPVMEKLFPELKGVGAENSSLEGEVEIKEFLPSKGYEWQDNPSWQDKFKQLLSA